MRIPERISLGGLGGGGGGGAAAGASGLTGNLIWNVVADQPSGTYATSLLEYVTTLLALTGGEGFEFQYLARETGTLDLTIAYAMTTSDGGNVELNVAIQNFGDGADPDGALPSASAVVITPGTGTTRKTTTLSLAVTSGDTGRIRVTRSNAGNDTHTGDMRILALAG